MLYGTLTESCTNISCGVMNAGPRYEYLWAERGSRTKRVSAPEYIEYLMTWIQSLLDNNNIFPNVAGAPFPDTFKKIVKKIFSRLFRVYAHIYHSHFKEVIALEEDAYLNTSFKHFILFVRQFNLVKEDQLQPLAEVIMDLVDQNNDQTQNVYPLPPEKERIRKVTIVMTHPLVQTIKHPVIAAFKLRQPALTLLRMFFVIAIHIV